jgi:hypothetical protein
MKFFFALAVLATSVTSFAASRDIYDIMYLPTAGTNYGFTEAGYITGEVKGRSGTADADLSAYGIEQTLGRSFSDQLSVQASLNYINGEVDEDGSPKTEQTGLSDPRFTARYRVLDGDMRLDVVGGALLSLGDSKIKSNGDRDNRQGGHALFAGAQIGKKAESIQWAVSGILTRNFERTYDLSGGDADVDANLDLAVRADLLNKITETGFIRSHFDIEFDGMQESDDTAPETVVAPATRYVLGAEYQHLCSANLLARVGVDYAMEKSNSGYQKSDDRFKFIVGANYQF